MGLGAGLFFLSGLARGGVEGWSLGGGKRCAEDAEEGGGRREDEEDDDGLFGGGEGNKRMR